MMIGGLSVQSTRKTKRLDDKVYMNESEIFYMCGISAEWMLAKQFVSESMFRFNLNFRHAMYHRVGADLLFPVAIAEVT